MFKMRFCNSCKNYTLSESHCSQMSVSAHPIKYNPNDKYGDYRRKAKFERGY